MKHLFLSSLLSSVLAMPSPPCPQNPTMECGGWMSCPGPVDSMGCQMGGTCVAYGDECPYNCPHVPFNDCPAQGMQSCPGPMDPMGCMTADTCVPLEEMCPFYRPYPPPPDCGEGMMTCPGPVDSMNCKMPDACVPYGDECPYN